MATQQKLPQIWSSWSGRVGRLWLLIAAIALIATACGAVGDSVGEAATDIADGTEETAEAFDVAEEVEAMESAEDGDASEVDVERVVSADVPATIATDGEAAAQGDAPEQDQLGASGSRPSADAPTDLGRDIIFTAEVTIEVDDVTTTGRQATEAISDLGGFVFGEDSTGGAQPTTTLVFKVRPSDFSAALDALGGIGELRSQRITTDDVTERVVDLQGRIDTTELGVERLRTAMEQANNLENFARLEEQLLARESDLEVLRGTLRTLRDRIDLATITLTVVQDRVQNGIEVETSRYEGHDDGAGCPGAGRFAVEPGDAVTVCFELVNTGDQTLTDVSLTDSVLEIDDEDLTVVFGDADDLQPGQALMLSYQLVAERTVNMRVAVTGTPTDGTSTEAVGPVVRTTLTPRIEVDQSAVTAGFGDGFDAATSLLARLWTFAQVLVGFVLPLLVLLPFAWLALIGLRRLRRNRTDRGPSEESGFQEMPPPPNVAGA